MPTYPPLDFAFEDNPTSTQDQGISDMTTQPGHIRKPPLILPPRLYVAPTEPPSLKAIATHITLFPETLGCDVIYLSYQPYTLIGFQRKEIGDFIASINDGRLQKELLQIAESNLSYCILILEGPLIFTNDGNLTNGTFTKASLRNILSSIQSQHILTVITDNLADTIQTVLSMGKYLAKPTHSSLARRPNQAKNSWGHTTSVSFATHLLQSFPNIGPGTAKEIYEHFGTIPLSWNVTASELAKVKGIGIKTATQLIKALEK